MWNILIYIWCLKYFLNEEQVSIALKLAAPFVESATVLTEKGDCLIHL